MVLLIPFLFCTLTCANVRFTFQYGSINTNPDVATGLSYMPFTFQYGSINTEQGIEKVPSKHLFTFQYGSINTRNNSTKNITF